MKYTKTTLKELTKRYALVLRKCAFLNAIIIGSMIAAPAMASVVDITEDQAFENLTNDDANNKDAAGLTIASGQELSAVVNGVSFDGNTSVNSGAAMKALNGFTAGDNWSFTDNHSNKISGGLYVRIRGDESNRTVVMGDNLTFTDNSSNWLGGALGIESADSVTLGTATFEDNSTNADGGAIAIWTDGTNGTESGTTLTLGKTTFTGNEAANRGGALAVLNNDDNPTAFNNTVIIGEGSEFTDNSAKTGGAIYNMGDLTATDTSFTDNEASSLGGAIYNKGALTLDNTTFEGNSTEGDGGAIVTNVTDAKSVVKITNSKFIGNEAISYGWADSGAISIQNGDVEISGSTFSGNHAQTGGAIYAYTGNNHYAKTTITDSIFEDNTAKTGGAIGHFSSSKDPKDLGIKGGMTLDNVTFRNNKATSADSDGGGALFLGSESETVLTNSLFEGNTSAADGGAIATRRAQINSDKNDNRGHLDIDNVQFISNTSENNGGAFFNAFHRSSASDDLVAVSNSTFTGNTAVNGGAVYNSGDTDAETDLDPSKTAGIQFTNTTFTDNTASGNGGAIYNAGTMTFNGTTLFSGNKAGDALNDIHNDGSITFNGDVTLDGGITGEGDVTFAEGSTLTATLNTTTILANSVTTNGANLNLIITDGTAEGTYDFVKAAELDQAFTLADNNLYDIVMLEDGDAKGSISYTKKSTADVIEALEDVTDATTAAGIASMTETTTTDAYAKSLAETIVALAQSDDPADQAKAAELTKATQPTRVPVQQAVNAAAQIFKAASGRMAQLRAGRSGGDLADAKLSPWIKGLANKNHNSQGSGFNAYSRGFAFGVDAQLTEDWLVGLGYGRTATTVKEYNRRTHVNGDNYFVYGKYQPAAWYVEGAFNYGHAKNKEQAVGLTAHYNVDTYGAQLFSGYQYDITDNYAGLRYVYVSPDDYNNGLNEVHAKNTQVVTAVIGTRVSKEFKQANSVSFKPEFRLAGTYDIKSNNARANVNVIGGDTTYSVDGHRLKRAALESGIGLTAKYGKMEFSADYDIEWRVSNFAQTGTLKFKYNF